VSRTPVTDRLERWLREAGVAFEIFEHAPVRTSEEAARARGTPLEAGAKALVVRADERFVHCVLPAHLKADNARLRGLVGTRKLRFATPEELQTLTGCAPGAVPPFGNLFGLPVLWTTRSVTTSGWRSTPAATPCRSRCAATTSSAWPPRPCAGSPPVKRGLRRVTEG